MSTHNQLIGVTGLTGVGKDYLMEASGAGTEFRTRNIGTLVGQLLGQNRDEMMGKSSFGAVREAQLGAYASVVAEQPLVVTCHAVRDMPDTGELGYDPEMERLFNPSAYIFVAAPPSVIQQRVIARNATGERKSPVRSVPDLKEEQSRKIDLMHELTGVLDTRLVILENVAENFDDNVKQIQALVQESGAGVTVSERTY